MRDKERGKKVNFDSISPNDLLLEFKPLIYKTMYRLNIKQNHADYDDFFQEMQIHLIEIFHKFAGDEENFEAERFKFTAYAGKGLYWYGIDLLHKGYVDNEQLIDRDQLDWFIESDGEVQDTPSSNVFIEDFLTQAKRRLSKQDYLLLLYLIQDNNTVQELADIMGVSRDTIYQRKKKIQTRLQDIKKCLMD